MKNVPVVTLGKPQRVVIARHPVAKRKVQVYVNGVLRYDGPAIVEGDESVVYIRRARRSAKK